MTSHIQSIEQNIADSTPVDVVSLPGAVTAILVGFARTGAPLVDIPGDPLCSHVAVRSCVPLNGSDVGKQVVVVPDVQNRESPIVMGIVHPPTSRTALEIDADGHTVAVHADENITLKCGEASITLHRDGKIVIRGRHVVSHASGVNRIRGASVQLN